MRYLLNLGKNSFKRNIFLTCFFISFFTLLISAYFFYQVILDNQKEQVREQVKDLANTVALLVDPEEHQQVTSSSSPIYQKLVGKLRGVQYNNANILYLYTLVPTAEKNILQFVLDTQITEDKNKNSILEPEEKRAEVGEKFNISSYSAMQEAFRESSADDDITQDKWGYSLSGYAPIRDSEGKTIAILGIDLAAPAILEARKEFQRNFYLVFFICLTIASLFSWILTEQLVKQLEEFVEASKKIQKGDFNHRFASSPINEVRILSQSFNAMLDEIYSTHSKRKAELEALQEISTLTTSEITLQEVLHRIVGIIVSVVGVERCSLRTYEEKGEKLVLQASYSLAKGYIEANQTVSLENPFFEVVKSKKAMVVNDISATEHKFPGPSGGETSGSAVAVPLIAKDNVLGLILVYSSNPSYYGPSEVELLTALANQAAIAIENGRLYKDLRKSYLRTITALAKAVEAKDTYTQGHAQRVAHYAGMIAKELGLSKDFLDKLQVAAILHDIGKIAIPEKILAKPGRLTEEEYSIIQKHPLRGREILQPVKFPQEIIQGVYYHHERLDGKGYPEGLQGEDIPLAARIIAIADAFDAMTSDRSYRRPISVLEALAEVKKCQDTQFDPQIVEAFLAGWERAGKVVKGN